MIQVHVETVVLLSHQVQNTVNIRVPVEKLSRPESKLTYQEIKDYILSKYNLNVSSLYIAQIKREFGIIEHENYATDKKDENQPKCPEEKRNAIIETLKHFQMID